MSSVSIEEIRWPSGHEDSELYQLHPELYKAIFIDRRNALISSPGGCGKSYTIGLIKKESNRLSIQCDLTSTTGVSAHNIRGSTIHRWSSIKLGDKPAEVIVHNIMTRTEAKNRWLDAQILVIDEVSMLGASILTLLNKVGQEVRISRKDMKQYIRSGEMIPAFGGLQIIFSADFLQLEPIKDKFAFNSPVWNQLNLFNYRLVDPYRYPDLKHFEMLCRIRVENKQKKIWLCYVLEFRYMKSIIGRRSMGS